MGFALRYWQLVRIDAAGQRKVEELAIAKTFFQQRLTPGEQADVVDTEVQQELLRFLRQEGVQRGDRDSANLCLRCYISYQIEQECIRLETKFGVRHGFNRYDLFPFVLDDDGRQSGSKQSVLKQSGSKQASTQYQSLAAEVLQTFDPQRAGLSTWVTRLVKSRRELNGFLREQGVYLESDWSILSQTKPDQLRRILSEFYALTSIEVERACFLLHAYHAIYSRDRLLQRQQGILKGKEKCLPPTPDQLTCISQNLREQVTLNLSNEAMMNRLQTLATQIRQYRLSRPPTKSLDQAERPIDVTAPQPDEAEVEQNEFLTFYREQFLICLDQAIEQAIADRLTYLQRKKPQTVEPFLTALSLFHCQGQAMGAIARHLGLRAQDAVTRLLELKNFRATVRQKLLMLLSDRVLDKAEICVDPSRLQDLDQRLEAALDEQIVLVMQAAETEATVARNRPLESLFAHRLCHHLDTRRTLR